MRICIFGPKADKDAITEVIGTIPAYSFRTVAADVYERYDSFIHETAQKEYKIIFVTEDNAAGMEGVIAAKKIFPDTPIVWLSNDNDFGTQSYRLGVAYFHTKPITASILQMALQKCHVHYQN